MSQSKIHLCVISVCLHFALLIPSVRAVTLQGHVYNGNVGDETQPLSGVTVTLYGSNNSGQMGTSITSTTTNSQGWYGLDTREGYEYYNIVETDPSGYTSVGATTVSGTTINNNWIQYAYPLTGKTLTGNKFWDKSSTPQNHPPVADAGPDQAVNTGDVVQLDGSASSDADGDPLTYSWSLTSVPAGSGASLNNPTAVQPKFTADLAGTYVAQLVVNDGKVDSNPDTVTVTATSQSPRTGTITGYKFNDTNGDGIWNGIESGLAGWTLFADMDPWNAQLDPGEPSDVTGPDGSYTLSGLAPGVYNVYEVAQPGWYMTCPGAGYYGITLQANDLYDHQDFGNHREGDQLEACCLPDGSCANLTAQQCRDRGGTPQGPGTICMGDTNGDGIDDVCGGQPAGQQYLFDLCLKAEINIPGLGLVKTTLTGPATMQVQAGPNGQASDLNGNGRDDAPAELVDLALTGMDPLVGAVHLHLNPYRSAAGQVEEQVNSTPGILDIEPFTATGSADSFFDVFFEVELPNLGLVLCACDSKRLSGVVASLTPGIATYSEQSPGTAISLYREVAGADVCQITPRPSPSAFLNSLTACDQAPPTARRDYGDAPDTYKTLQASGGAYHKAGSLTLGASIDVEQDGQPGPDATGDDLAGTDDEDSLISSLNLTTGQIAMVSLTVANDAAVNDSGMVAGWIDFDGNGQFDWVSDDIGTQYVSVPGGGQATVQFAFLVPPGSKAGKTYARFRLYRDDPNPMAIPWAVLPTGPADYGEVEDYVVTIRSGISSNDRDYGDAPLPYPSADHPLGGPYLGPFGDLPDRDPAMQRDATASGDDTDADGDDEDGLLSVNLVKASGVWSHAEIRMWTSSTGALTGGIWIDWNTDGDWDDSGELVGSAGLSSTPVPPGGAWIHITWGFPIPAIAKPGNTFARLRVYEGFNVTLSPNGAGGAGEVEDHLVQIKAEGPGLPPGGIVHGYKWYDRDGDGVWDIAEPGLANWRIWLDLNGNGMDDTGDLHETTDSQGHFRFVGVPAGKYIVGETPQAGWTQTCPASPGTYTETVTPGSASFPLVFGNTTRPGQPPDTLKKLDWGDAPDPTYPTLRAGNGAYHPITPGFQLGATIDPEPDGQPSPDAMADDFLGSDDEDGVFFLTPLLPGQMASLEVLASAAGKVDAWIDFDVDGTWTQATDQIFKAQAVSMGSNFLSAAVPAGAKVGTPALTRFRFSSAGNLPYDGPAQDGEVEDYQVWLGEGGPLPPGLRHGHLKWSQPPIEIDPNLDPNSGPPVFCGWDQRSKSSVLDDQRRVWQIALDDFHCLGPIPITRIRWWGSYKGWDKLDLPEVLPEAWQITFWINRLEQVDAVPFAERLAWRLDVPAERVRVQPVGRDQFPQQPAETCFMYELALDPNEWFRQAEFPSEQDVYWIGIAAVYAPGAEERSAWGWMTRPEPWRDPAQLTVLYGDGPDANTQLWSGMLQPRVNSLLCAQEQGFDMTFELLTEEPWVKWDLPLPSLRDWPYAADRPSKAIENEKGQIQVMSRVADDWVCRSPDEPVIALAWYGSYIGYGYEACSCEKAPDPRRPDSFLISIWTDAPADTNSTYSHPGQPVWEYKALVFDEVQVGYDCAPMGEPNEPVFRYTVRLPEPLWFWQEKVDQLYWLSIVAVYKEPVNRIAYPWGWTDRPHDAIGIATGIEYNPGVEPRWRILRDPLDRGVDLCFTLYTRPPGP